MQRTDRWTVQPDETAPLEHAIDDGLREIVVVQDAAPALERFVGGEDHRPLAPVPLVRVRIVAGRFAAEHVRQWQPGDGSILPEHRAERVAAVSGKRARRYLQRQHLIDLGPAALAYLTELTHRRSRTWVHDVEQLHAVLQSHGDAALRTAFARGLAEQAIGAEYIAHYLDATVPPLPFEDRPTTIAAARLPRGSRVQVAEGAHRGGAQRSTWTRLSTAAASRRVGGRS